MVSRILQGMKSTKRILASNVRYTPKSLFALFVWYENYKKYNFFVTGRGP